MDKFIRENIVSHIKDIVNKTEDDVIKTIDKKMKALISEKQYNEFVDMGILSAETIRMSGSSATSLNDINREIKTALVGCIMEYIAEAKRRLEVYNKAKEVFDKELNQKESELSSLKAEKDKIGLFAFSKKKEMSALIDSKASEISEFKRTNEPKDLWNDFERMYS